jgi:hypothetical protein
MRKIGQLNQKSTALRIANQKTRTLPLDLTYGLHHRIPDAENATRRNQRNTGKQDAPYDIA